MSDAAAQPAAGRDRHGHALSEEDSGRADFYALLGRLFYAAPDAALLDAIAGGTAEQDDGAAGALPAAWARLRAASRAATPDSVKEEHDALFIGVGKAPVTPYTSGYVAQVAPDRHLLQLRELLGQWGLGRQDGVFDSEDHISGLCDVMRFLISKNQPLEMQKRFFDDYVLTGALPLCDAVIAAPGAVFYRQVALFGKAFFEVEQAAFDMLIPDGQQER